MTIDRHLSASDLKFNAPRNLTPQQRAKWDAAYGAKNAAFKDAKLEGDELLKWKYQRYVKDYLRCIDSVDENVGRLLDYLEQSGLAENTVVIYSSDQGWYLGEHGWYDKRWMYEESFRTPLIVRWPGVNSKPDQKILIWYRIWTTHRPFLTFVVSTHPMTCKEFLLCRY